MIGSDTEKKLRRRAISGNPISVGKLGRYLISSAFGDLDRELEGVNLLKEAYESGNSEAGYELAQLREDLREKAKIDENQCVALLKERALQGYPGEALELYYHHYSSVELPDLIEILRAASKNSAEIQEILRKISSG